MYYNWLKKHICHKIRGEKCYPPMNVREFIMIIYLLTICVENIKLNMITNQDKGSRGGGVGLSTINPEVAGVNPGVHKHIWSNSYESSDCKFS